MKTIIDISSWEHRDTFFFSEIFIMPTLMLHVRWIVQSQKEMPKKQECHFSCIISTPLQKELTELRHFATVLIQIKRLLFMMILTSLHRLKTNQKRDIQPYFFLIVKSGEPLSGTVAALSIPYQRIIRLMHKEDARNIMSACQCNPQPAILIFKLHTEE